MENKHISLFSRVLMVGNGGQVVKNDPSVCHACNCQEELSQIKKEVQALEE